MQLISGFEEMLPQTVKLSTLRDEFHAQKKRTAIQRMQQRSRVRIDEGFLYKKEEPQLAWGAREHFLDYYLLVPAEQGLHVLLPTSRGDPSYVFRLDLHKRGKQWRARYGDLEFDLSNRMLFIGTYHQEEIWMAMVPRTFVTNDLAEGTDMMDQQGHGSRGHGVKDTTLTEEQYCQVICYLAYHLKQQGFRDIYLRQDFPELSIPLVKTMTNLM